MTGNSTALHEERAHAILPPSSAHRDSICTGSVLFRMRPDFEPKPREAAKEGTIAHQYLELMRRKLLDQQVLSNVEIEKECQENIPDDTLAGIIATCIQRDRHTENLFAKDAVSLKRFVEHRVLYNEYSWGTLDYALVKLKHNGKVDIFIQDYKHGYDPVAARDNWQLIVYALALYTTERLSNLEWIYLTIYQPRSHGPALSPWRISVEELEVWRPKVDKYIEKAIAVREGRAAVEYAAGKHCKYCWGEGRCQAQNAANSERAVIALNAADAQQEVNVQTLSMEQMLSLMDKKETIERILGEVEGHLYMRLNRNLPVPGWKMVEQVGKRKLNDADEEYTAKELKKIGVKQPWRKSLITLGDAEKAVGKSKAGLVDALTVRHATKRVMVRESDKRPAITMATGADLLGAVTVDE